MGAGLMGSQIGCEYAIGGHDVRFIARDPDLARQRVENGLSMIRSLGVVNVDVAVAASSHISVGTELDGTYDLLVESLPEDLELKLRTLLPMVNSCPDAVVATNTSSLSISALGDGLGAPKRTIGTHYWNPPLLMPLVEVVPGNRTDSAVVALITETLRALGKRPVVVSQDVPGFVWNRLQLALLREALWIVRAGIASVETVDEIVRDGLARRWRHVGPFRMVALGGVATWLRIGSNLLPSLSEETDLQGLDEFVSFDDESLEETRRLRDQALADELKGEARTTRSDGPQIDNGVG